MIASATYLAFNRLFSAEFRHVLYKSIGLTLLGLLAVWFGLRELFDYLALPWIDAIWQDETTAVEGWLSTIAAIATGLIVALFLALLVAPVTAAVAGLFLDDAAEVIEREDYPSIGEGRALDLVPSIRIGAKFLVIALLGNLLALALLLVPGVNLVAFFAVNAYLLGREFFEFAAMRYRSEEEAQAFRRRHSGTVLAAGVPIAALLSVPILNILTPLFAAALMVHLHMKLSRKDAAFALPPRGERTPTIGGTA